MRTLHHHYNQDQSFCSADFICYAFSYPFLETNCSSFEYQNEYSLYIVAKQTTVTIRVTASFKYYVSSLNYQTIAKICILMLLYLFVFFLIQSCDLFPSIESMLLSLFRMVNYSQHQVFSLPEFVSPYVSLFLINVMRSDAHFLLFIFSSYLFLCCTFKFDCFIGYN